MMFGLALAGCGLAMILALIRAAKGPTAFDRVLAVNAIGTIIILGVALHGFIMGRPEFVDISILYAVLNFIGTFAILKLFATGGLGDRGGNARITASSDRPEEGDVYGPFPSLFVRFFTGNRHTCARHWQPWSDQAPGCVQSHSRSRNDGYRRRWFHRPWDDDP